MITPSTHPIPASGTFIEVADGVFWLRMPLPFVLDHINLYVLEDDDGLFIVDTGVQSEQSKAIWQQLLLAFNKPLKGVIATHMHPDHCGLAGWLCQHYRVPLYMSALEYFGAIASFSPNTGTDCTPELEYFLKAGLPSDQAHAFVSGRSQYVEAVAPLPSAYHRLKQESTLTIGQRNWQILTFGGHSPEHVCLFDEKNQLLIGGDQILPFISPNIGVYSREPEANPLTDYLESLVLLGYLPVETLVLPAHNQPYTGLRTRCQELQSHHESLLAELVSYCTEPRLLVDCLTVLYKRPLTGQLLFFAVAEALAHVNYLIKAGLVTRSLDTQNRYCYQTRKKV